MAAPAVVNNYTIRPNVTPEELLAKKEEAIRLAVQLALQKNLGTTPNDIAVQDIYPEDLGLTTDDIAWAAPSSAGWNKVVDSVQVKDKVIVFYGVKSVGGDPAVGIRLTQGNKKDLQIRGEYGLHTMYLNVNREANALFPELVKYVDGEYLNIYLRFKSTDASKLIPLAVVAKPKSQVVG